MICRLCDQNKVLCDSHIFPEFCYDSLYDVRFHRFYQLSTNPEKRTIRRPKGLYEKLLCTECEKHLKQYEDYFKKVIDSKEGIFSEQTTHFKISGLDYKLFKLFLLSILWRCSVSKRIEFPFSLGPKENILKEKILSNDPGEESFFPFFWIVNPKIIERCSQGIMPPWNVRQDSYRMANFFILGIFWTTITSKHASEHYLREFFFSRNGDLSVFFDENYLLNFFSKMIQDFRKYEKFPENTL